MFCGRMKKKVGYGKEQVYCEVRKIWKKADVEEACKRLDHGKFIQPDLTRLKIEITYEKVEHSKGWFHVKEYHDDGKKIRIKDNVIIGTKSRLLSSKNKCVKYLYRAKYCRIYRELTPEQVFYLGYCIAWGNE